MPLQFIFTKDSFIPDKSENILSEQEHSLCERFISDRYKTLFDIGSETTAANESMSLGFLRTVSERFIKALTSMPELELVRENANVILSDEACDDLLETVPFGIGTEYIDRDWLNGIFEKLNEVYCWEMSAYSGTVQMFLTEKGQQLRVPERIFFHLVESRDDDFPFAFMATYATTDENGQVRHLPLSYALTEFKGDRERLITLLSCLNKVSEVSPMLGRFVESGEMFHPLKLSAEEAYTFLKSVPEIETCGVLCRVPDWWRKRYSSVSANVVLGEKKQSMLGFDTLISMVPELSVNGEALTKSDIDLLLKQTEGLAQLKGKWVEVNHAELRELLAKMDKYGGELTFLQALRMQSGADDKNEVDVGIKITNGKWLNGLLKSLRHPADIKSVKAPAGVKATLRPYQLTGFNWLLCRSRGSEPASRTIWDLVKHCRY